MSAPKVELPLEARALEALLALAYAAYVAMDDAEEDRAGTHRITKENALALCRALDALDDLPDDRPGYTMAEAAKARWALRSLIGEGDRIDPEAFRKACTRGLTMTEAGNLFADLSDLNLSAFEACGDGPTPKGALEIYELGKQVRRRLAPDQVARTEGD